MLRTLRVGSLQELCAETVPASIRLERPLDLPPGKSEHELLADAWAHASRNKVARSYIGLGYHDCVTPPVILRNILENPGWYTAYTPYQAEIAQGRLEALVNFQQMVMDLTGLEVANASMLDEATAAAEAMMLSHAAALGVEVVVSDPAKFDFSKKPCGILLQYPDTDGGISDWSEATAKAKEAGAFVTFAADLLALCLLKSPGEIGADAAIGSSQR